jgi:hypothetical protein
MDIKLYRLILCFLSVFFIFPSTVFAHPGRTAADGCHYCRTNCAKWGEVEGERHCHGGGIAAPVEKPVVIKKVVPTRIPPTRRPTVVPTSKPTATPTLELTLIPTIEPTETLLPTLTPTLLPTKVPSPTPVSQVKGETKTIQQQNIFSKLFSWLFKK